MPVVPVPCPCGGDGGPACTAGPISSTGLCLADNTPIAVIYSRDCETGAVTQHGYVNLLTGIFFPGAPPAGAHACGEHLDFELTRWCDLNPDGSVIAHVLIEYEYDEETGQLVGTRLLTPLGEPYNGGAGPVGVLGNCGGDQIFQHQEILCDHRPGTPTPGPATSDAAIAGTAMTPTGAQHAFGGIPQDIPLPTAQQLWNGQAISVGPNAAQNIHEYMAAEVAVTPECGTLDPAGASTVSFTVRITNTGANCGCGLWGEFSLWNGATRLAGQALGVFGDAANASICPGQIVTATIPATAVPNAALLAGDISIALNVQTGQDGTPDGVGCPVNGPEGTSYTLDQFAATVAQPVAVVDCGTGEECPGPVVPFIRKYIEDARGVVLDTVDLTFDGLGYNVQGNVGRCLPESQEQTFGVQLCDVLPDGTVIPFLRTYTTLDGEVIASCDKDLGGIEDYEPTGEVKACDTVSSCNNCQLVPLCDTFDQTSLWGPFTPPPTDPELIGGTIGLQDGYRLTNGVAWTFDSTRAGDGGSAFTIGNGNAADGANMSTLDDDPGSAYLRFDHAPKFVTFRVGGLSTGEVTTRCLTLPEGTIQVGLVSPHSYDPETRLLCLNGAAGTVKSSFRINGPGATLEFTSANKTSDAAVIDQVRVAATVIQPFMRRLCMDCDGNITAFTDLTADGSAPYATHRVTDCAVAAALTGPAVQDVHVVGSDCRHCETFETCDAGDPAPALRLTGAVNASSGSFANGVTWLAEAGRDTDGVFTGARSSNKGASSVDGLWWQGVNSFPADAVGPVRWTWGSPQVTEFSVAMVYTSAVDPAPLVANTVQLPVGVIPVKLPQGYHFDPATSRVYVDSTVVNDGVGNPNCNALLSPTSDRAARFRTTAPVTSVTLNYLGSRVAVCGQFGSYAFGAFQIGGRPSTQFLRTVCRDCDGTVISTDNRLMDGVTEYFPSGAIGSCPEHCETLQLCDGYHGEADITGTFGAGSSSGKMANGVSWTATGPAAAIVGLWGFPGTDLGTETYTFSKAVDWVELDLSVAGSESTPECIRIPGFELVPGTLTGISGTWDPDTQTLCGTAKAGTFRRRDVSSFTVQKTSDTGGISGTWKVRASIDLDVPFLRTICRNADRTAAGAPIDTTLDGSTAYFVGGTVGTCLGKDCCQPVQVCIRTTTQGVSDFITNPLQADDGTVESGWTWAPGTSATNPGGPTDPADVPQWYPMYKKSFDGQSGGSWRTIDSAPNKAGWIAPHPNARVNNTGAVGEGPSLDEQPPGEHWWARSSFTLPAAADPGSVKVQVTVLNADQVALRYRWNNGPWVSGGGNYTSVAPYTTPAQTVPGVVPGANTLYFEVLENANSVTDPSNGAGVKAHFIVTYDMVGVAQRSWTRMVCCDGSEYYLDENNVRQDSLPDGWMITPCGNSPQPVVLCDDNGSFIRHYYYSGDQVLYRDTDEFGVTYLPVGDVRDCSAPATPTPDAAVSTGIRRLTGGASFNVKTTQPGLQSVTLTVLAGAVDASTSSGLNQTVPAGVSLTWSVNDTDDSSLAFAIFTGTSAAADFIVHFTYKAAAAG